MIDYTPAEVWVRMPAMRGNPPGDPQRCRPDAIGYAIHNGYEPCDPPAVPVAAGQPLAAAALLAPKVTEPVVIVNKAKRGRPRRG